MALQLEDYALVGDTRTAALVGRDGSMDWLCLPRFDSDACFAALLGRPQHGRWLVGPGAGGPAGTRRYRGDSLVLETEFETPDGTVRLIDCMPPDHDQVCVVRRIEGIRGRVPMRTELNLRFDYGRTEPWLRREDRRLMAIAGPNTVVLDAGIPVDVVGGSVTAEFSIAAGDAVDLRLGWTEPNGRQLSELDAAGTIEATERWWNDWASQCQYHGPHRDDVLRSLLTLKALIYAPSGGIVAAPTCSLPELLGGVRNWDYRYCWIRDATYTLLVLLHAGYTDEAVAWREWLLRAVAGRPAQMQIMYGVDGRRRLPELELDWLPGYADSRPVRIGNAASGQRQLDVYGELMDALHQARTHGIAPDPDAWRVQRELLDFLESNWQKPDQGIWEVRGQRRNFTHSKVMAWVAADRAVKAVEQLDLDGPADRWRRLRQEIFDEVCEKGYDASRNTFTQYYGSSSVDASLLLMAPVGFLPAGDPRVVGTVDAIEADLCNDDLVRRYPPNAADVDALPSGEGVFLACTFWLADNYLLRGDVHRGQQLFERLLRLSNDVGLLAEEYDVDRGCLVGNFPQALSHLQLVETALNLTQVTGPGRRRAGSDSRADPRGRPNA